MYCALCAENKSEMNFKKIPRAGNIDSVRARARALFLVNPGLSQGKIAA